MDVHTHALMPAGTAAPHPGAREMGNRPSCQSEQFPRPRNAIE